MIGASILSCFFFLLKLATALISSMVWGNGTYITTTQQHNTTQHKHTREPNPIEQIKQKPIAN